MFHILRKAAISTAAILLMAASMAGQTSDPTQEKPHTVLEVTPFAGYQWFVSHPVQTTLNGIVGGVRLTEDFSRWYGLEEGYTFGINDTRLRPFPGSSFGQIKIETRNYHAWIAPVVNLAPREYRLRPYLTLGPGVAWYFPNPNGLLLAGYNGLGNRQLKMNYGPALSYGGGIKFNINRYLAIRYDIRGVWTQQPHYGIPTAPNRVGGIYSPHEGGEESLQYTGGISFRFGVVECPSQPESFNTDKYLERGGQLAVSISNSGGSKVCPGSTVVLTANATGLNGQTPTYTWKNGSETIGDNSPTLNLTRTGNYNITVTVTVPESRRVSSVYRPQLPGCIPPPVDSLTEITRGATATSSSPVSVVIGEDPPTITALRADPTTVTKPGRSTLTAEVNWTCNDQARVEYGLRSGEGTVTGNVYDSSSVTFDPTGPQQKTATVYARATNQGGTSPEVTTNITVNNGAAPVPTAKRLPDINFGYLSARVNQCGKRVLQSQVAPQLSAPGGTIVLVGHVDDREKSARGLDRRRVLNTAAVLSGRGPSCDNVDLSRIKVKWVGTAASNPNPTFCSVSEREYRGQRVRESEAAKKRSVEIWFIPAGAEMPAELRDAQDAPAGAVKALGCPK